MQTVPAPVDRVTCQVSIGHARYSIQSPWTGRTITLPRPFAPTQLRGRIVKGAIAGHVASFTKDELRQFAAAERACLAHRQEVQARLEGELAAELERQRAYRSWTHGQPSRRSRIRVRVA